jgi:lysophospholipase L1-like esterase
VDFGPLRVMRRVSLLDATQTRVTQFEQLPPRSGRVVFLGDSGIEAGLWNEWFPTLPCANRGVGGDTVSGVRLRLNSAIHQPLAIVLLVGTNDLAGIRRGQEESDIADQFRGLMTDLTTLAPDAAIFLNSITPRASDMSDSICSLNNHYRDIADETGAIYIDLWHVLSDSDRSLRKELTFDGLHLNGLGYRIWVDVLRPYLEPLGNVQVKPG